ncbi:unnamed protein product [Thlaspi arvense]|uniref:Major facilitator superfamily (MFS) profile domain-containing protein n=1 Tax=Thlaspi arvense TaxID=13288 RepID=A0AAU9SAS8_THLAR|nr:unnamed protein product [Thlaspi arvense]
MALAQKLTTPHCSEAEAASLKAHSKEYPWAARMNQSLRNLHRGESTYLFHIPHESTRKWVRREVTKLLAVSSDVRISQAKQVFTLQPLFLIRLLHLSGRAAHAVPKSLSTSSLNKNRLIVIFCIINLLNYMDRGAIASNGVNDNIRTCNDKGKCNPATGIQPKALLRHFNRSNFEDGVLSSSFMVGLLIASPIFASLAKRFVGVGEASFISLAAPFIDDNAPHKQKAVWLGVFYMCIPSGVALGYVYGGFVGKHFSWRYAFWGEAVLMAPFAVLGFLMKPLQLKGFPSTDSIKMASSVKLQERSFEMVYSVCKEKVFVVIVLGYVSYNFVIVAYSYWGPKAGYNIYKMKNADMIFGAVTIICGIIGTLSGGFILDRVTATIPNAFKLLTGATFLGAIFCFTAFTLKSLYGFIALFELLVFATQAPVNYVCLHCVKPSLRPLSMAMSTVAIHIFGDVPSSPLVGIVQDHINSWRKTTLILTSVLFLAAAIWFIGIFINSVDRCNE